MLTWQEKAKDILSALKVTLSKEQNDVFYREARLKLLGGGEGSGKSFLGALTGIARPIADIQTYGLERQLIWIVGADFEDARKEFDYIKDWCDELNISKDQGSSIPSLKGSSGAVLETTLGIRYETISAYDVRKIGREQPDGIIGAEVSRWGTTGGSSSGVEIWRRAQGRLMRTFPRAWGFFSGSFETSVGWFPEEFQRGQAPNAEGLVSMPLPSWANLDRYPGGWDSPAIQLLLATEPPARFQERYGGKPAPPTDAVFPEFRASLHVTDAAEFDEEYPVYLAVDPGDKVYCVLFVQFVGGFIRVVDEVYVQRYTHEQIVQAAGLRAAWKGTGPYGHVMDIAGTQHHMGAAETPVEAWYNSSRISFSRKKRPVRDQLEKLRSVLALNPVSMSPYLQVNPQCTGLIAEGGGGPSPIEGVGVWRHKAGVPEHANNHAWNALAYLLLHHFGSQKAYGDPVDEQGSRKPVSYLNTPKTRGLSYLERF